MTTSAELLPVIKRSHFKTHKDLQQLRFPAQSPLSVQRLYRRNRILQKSCPCCQAVAAFLKGVLSGQNLFHPLMENVNLSSSFHFYQASFWPSYAQYAYVSVRSRRSVLKYALLPHDGSSFSGALVPAGAVIVDLFKQLEF